MTENEQAEYGGGCLNFPQRSAEFKKRSEDSVLYGSGK